MLGGLDRKGEELGLVEEPAGACLFVCSEGAWAWDLVWGCKHWGWSRVRIWFGKD